MVHPRRWKEVKRGSSRLLTYNLPESPLPEKKVALFDLDTTLIKYEKDILHHPDDVAPLTTTLQQGSLGVSDRSRETPPVYGCRICRGRDYEPEHARIEKDHTATAEDQGRKGLHASEVRTVFPHRGLPRRVPETAPWILPVPPRYRVCSPNG